MGAWRPEQAGNLANLNVGPILEPLNNLKSYYSIVSGLKLPRQPVSGDGEHAAAAAMFLTSKEPPNFRNENRHFDSADQVIGDYLKKQKGHRFSSLVMSPSAKSGRDGFNPAIWVPGFTGNISYFGGRSVEKTTNPLILFDSLFPNSGPPPENNGETLKLQAQLRRRQSILDHSKAATQRLNTKLSASDKARLDQYLTGIREAEAKITEQLGSIGNVSAPTMAVTRPPQSVHQTGNEDSFTNSNHEARLKTFIDLSVLAFQAELTPVGSLMLDTENSTEHDTRRFASIANISMPFFNNVNQAALNSLHHDISHSQDRDKMLSINRYQTTFLRYLMEKLRAVNEVNGNMLDNTMILYGCGIGDSNQHNHDDLPILVAGKGGGLVGGKHVFHNDKSVANLLLTFMKKMGLPNNSFANSNGTIEDI